MNAAYKMFLYAVEEMNFTKAASRAFVTQQCLSSNIKHLEEELSVILFNRHPKLSLTPAGKILYETVRKMNLLEINMENRLRLIREESSGTVTLGINSSRCRNLIRYFYRPYRELYPDVKVDIVLEDNIVSEMKLLKGELDLFLGVNYKGHECVSTEKVTSDCIVLVTTNRLLHVWYHGEGDFHPLKNGETLDLRQYPGLPIVGNRKASSFYKVCEDFMRRYNIVTSQDLFISDYESQFVLCAQSVVAALCPQSMLGGVRHLGSYDEGADAIIVVYIKDLDEQVDLSIVRPEGVYIPQYLTDFIDIFKEAVKAVNYVSELLMNGEK